VNNHSGSWEGGVNGAEPGIVMEANPKVGDTYQQEFAKGIAQDKATLLKLNKSICVPFGCFNNILETKDFSPLEAGVVEHKYYAAGVGQLSTIMVWFREDRRNLIWSRFQPADRQAPMNTQKFPSSIPGIFVSLAA
jgi:hypothetical protein